MKYTMISRKRQGRLTATGLDGGLNRRDLPSAVADNQLTAADNLWWREGVLRTRPALRVVDTTVSEGERTYVDHLVTRKEIGSVTAGALCVDGTQVWNNASYRTDAKSAFRVRFDVTQLDGWNAGEGDGTLLFLGNGQVLAPLAAGGYHEMDEYLYVPLLLAGGKGAATLFDPPPAIVRFEERNLLTPKFRANFTTDGIGKLFHLPVDRVDTTRPIVAQYRDGEGNLVTHTLAAGEREEQTAGADGLRMVYFAYRRCIYFLPPEGEAEMLAPAAAGVSDNLTVTAYADVDGMEDADVIGGMRFGCWFGGDYGGLVGGTRLFVAGNGHKPNRIYWSDTENPLYFPADNYAAVGDPAEAVTAFGKQGELLVIFKEHELYAASYRAQGVTDENVSGARFPIMPLHGSIGCDCPNTVQLCENRLVWLTSEGRVYTLTGNNAFSGCNVRAVSGMVERDVKTVAPSRLRAASAGYYQGWYLLLAGSAVYALRCADSAFSRVGSYDSDELAQRGMVWCRWTFDFAVAAEHIAVIGDRALLVDIHGRSYLFGGTKDSVVFANTVQERAITCRLATKLFDFGHFERLKSVREVLFAFGAAEDCVLTAVYVTDRGRRSECRHVFVKATDEGATDFLRTCRLTPHATKVRRFGLELAVEGAVAIGALEMRYDIDNVTERGVSGYANDRNV